jgi:RNA polymerase sigma-70 factor, ECF subfamily
VLSPPTARSVGAICEAAGNDGWQHSNSSFLRRLGRLAEAADAYRAAIELAGTDSERRYLKSRLTDLWDG